MDVLSLRSEIKSWEHAFKTEHQRNPTLDDIRALPKIAGKYKLYKKLSKEAPLGPPINGTENGIPPSTPRRSSALPGPSSLLPKSRPVPHSISDATPNPFSPSKSSRKRLINSDEPPLPKPHFLKRPSTKRSTISSLSPDPFPPIDANTEAASPLVNTAVKKARKRLRGDLVSPSPKKPRTIRLSPQAQPDSDEGEPDTSYVDESPVKADLSNGKHFKLLFEDGRLSQPDFSRKKGPFSRTKSVSDPFSSQARAPSSSKNETMNLKPSRGQNGKVKSRPSVQVVKSAPYAVVKSNFPDDSPTTDAPASDDAAVQLQSRKRASSADADASADNNSFAVANNGLLPPSPPTSPKNSGTSAATGKGSSKNRKKAKLVESKEFNEDYTDDESSLQVVEIDSQSLRRKTLHAADENEDDEAGLESVGFVTKDNKDGLPEIEDDTPDKVQPDVNLPENLRSVLHISSSHRNAHEAKALVESLLQGKPGPQDTRGEVWGIGEVEDATATTTDDEWAGEGVPWEAAEL